MQEIIFNWEDIKEIVEGYFEYKQKDSIGKVDSFDDINFDKYELLKEEDINGEQSLSRKV